MPTVPESHRRGTRAAQPAATVVTVGTLYFVIDEGVTERSNGTIWESYSAGATTRQAEPTVQQQFADLEQEIKDLRAEFERLRTRFERP